MGIRLGIVLFAAAASVVATGAEPAAIDMDVDRTAVIPPAATHYMGREIAQTMHYTGAPWLVRESRQREEDCRLLLEALEIREGQEVCDLGCGNGFYTLELARRVGPEGIVHAVDIQPEMLRLLARRAAEEGLTNIRPILGTVVDPRLPKGTLDLVLCVDVYHEFSHPEPMLARIRESLAEDGRLVLAEFRGEDPAVPIKPLHKMTKAQVRAELEPAGFRLEREFDRLPWQHLLFFGVRRGAGAK
jgi:SAM-dependent methyltransferase